MIENIFTGDGFSQLSLTTALNKIPTLYGEIGKMQLFEEKPISTTNVMIEQRDGESGLIVSTDRGTAGAKNKSGKRSTRYFEVPRFRLEDQIKPQDIQNVRAFGSENELETVDMAVLQKLEEMKRKHDQTKEFLRAQALQGLVLDGDGKVVYDLFAEFGVTKKIINMDLANAASEIQSHVNEFTQHVQENLKGSNATGMAVICSPSFFNKLVSNADVKEAYRYYSASGIRQNNPVLSNVMSGFEHLDATWISYGGKASVLNSDGTSTVRQFIPDDKAYVVPLGTTGLFQTSNAPADTMETVNTLGLPYNSWIDPQRTWVDLVTETNPLSLCNQPEVLVELTASA